MRTCPHCGGEIRPSVIRCVHCGTALQSEPQPASAVAGSRRTPAETQRRAAVSAPATVAVAAPVPTPEVRDHDGHAAGDPWVIPAPDDDARLPGVTSSTPIASSSARHVDGRLMGAAVLAVATAVIAVSSLSLPWIDGRLSVVGTRRTRAVAELTLRASDSYGGTIAVVIAATMSILGVLWFWYGMDRTSHVPAFAHPALTVIVGLAGWAAIGASAFGSFFWERAFVEHAQEAGLTPEAMQAILDDRARRLVELERLAGFNRFGLAATAAVLTGVVAIWSQVPRRPR